MASTSAEGTGAAPPLKVFIGHKAKDGLACYILAYLLESHGIPTWFYERDNVGGIPYSGNQRDILMKEARGYILILSREALGKSRFSKTVTSHIQEELDDAKFVRFQQGNRFVNLFVLHELKSINELKGTWLTRRYGEFILKEVARSLTISDWTEETYDAWLEKIRSGPAFLTSEEYKIVQDLGGSPHFQDVPELVQHDARIRECLNVKRRAVWRRYGRMVLMAAGLAVVAMAGWRMIQDERHLEVEGRKLLAEAQLERSKLLALNLDPAQGFDRRLSAIETQWRIGNEASRNGHWGDVISACPAVIKNIDDVQALNGQRAAARTACDAQEQARLEAAGLLAQEAAPAEWAVAERGAEAADALFEAGKFTAAEDAWGKVAGNWKAARDQAERVAACRQSKTRFEEELDKLDKALLKEYGGDDWKAIESLMESGSACLSDPLPAKKAYDEALARLPAALKIASENRRLAGERERQAAEARHQAEAQAAEAKRQAEVQAALLELRAVKVAGNWESIEKQARAVQQLDPSNPEARVALDEARVYAQAMVASLQIKARLDEELGKLDTLFLLQKYGDNGWREITALIESGLAHMDEPAVARKAFDEALAKLPAAIEYAKKNQQVTRREQVPLVVNP